MIREAVYTEEALNELANEIAQELRGGETIFLTGELGAGKTTFTRALVNALHSDAPVSSPTFQLVNEYPIDNQRRIIHADLYRLQNPDDVITLGLDDYIADPGTITIIEWPEIGAPHLPTPDMHVAFTHRDPTTRHIHITDYSKVSS